jgi:formyl-CoA transferase
MGLVKTSDAVIENFRPGTLEGWGLGYEALRKVNEKIVLIRVSGFGQTGPYSHRPAFDCIGQAMGGLTYLTGYPQSPPVKTGFAMAEYFAGAFNALAALIALYHRDIKDKKEGQWVDVSLYESIFRVSIANTILYDKLGTIMERAGNEIPALVAPGGNFMTMDGKWLVMTIPSDHLFVRLAKAMGNEGLAQDPRFALAENRLSHREEINKIVTDWFANHNMAEILNTFEEAEIPITSIYSIKDIFEDPHHQARGNIVEVDMPSVGKVKIPGVIPKFYNYPGSIKLPAPKLGEHNQEILPQITPINRETIYEYTREKKAISHISSDNALEGLRILDIATFGAGPFGTTILGDFGAEIIKVEMPVKGDRMRGIPPYYQGHSLFWIVESRNKKSITLDLRKEEGQKTLKELVKISDVVLENYRPGTLAKWNLSYEELKKVNEKIILVSVSGFGQTGPYHRRPSFDRIGLAMGGITYLTGYPEDPPVRPGMAMCDYLTSVLNALATMIAVYNRSKTGKGEWVDVALFETILRISEYTIPLYHKFGIVREPTGNLYPFISPGDIFQTKDDKWIFIYTPKEKFFQKLLMTMGREDLLEDQRFRLMEDRITNQGAINSIVRKWVKVFALPDLMEVLDKADIPFGPVLSFKDIMEDPHYKYREDIVEVEDKNIGRVKMKGIIPKFSLTPGRIRHTGPSIGEHNEEIYCGLLGYSKEALTKLRDEGLI